MVVAFNSNLRRQQILFELVSQRNTEVFTKLMQSIGGGTGYSAQQSTAQEAMPKQDTSKMSAWAKIAKNIEDKQSASVTEAQPKMSSAAIKSCVEFLDKNCLINPNIGLMVFEQFLIQCVLTKKRLIKARGQTNNPSSFKQHVQNYQSRKLDQIFNDMQREVKLEVAQKGPTKTGAPGWNAKPKQKVVIDESFRPYCQCLQALFDYYLIEYSTTLNNQIAAIFGKKEYKSFLMHVNVFLVFLHDFSVFQDTSSAFAGQINKFPEIFRFIWKEMSGFNVEITNKAESAERKYQSLSADRSGGRTMASLSRGTAPGGKTVGVSGKRGEKGGAEEKQKQHEAQLQRQLEVYEKAKTYASYLVFSEFFEILFRIAMYADNDTEKSDVLKFKEFLQRDVFSNLKFMLRLKKDEEEKKPHKAKLFKMVSRFHKVHQIMNRT